MPRHSAGALLLAILLLAVGLLAARNASASTPSSDLLTPAERAWLAAHPRIVLGAGEDWAPYAIRDARGRLSGFAVDHLALLNSKLGTNIQLEAGPWHQIVARAEAGEIDGLTITAPVAERRERFAFTEPFISSHNFIWLRTGDAKKRDVPRGLDALRGQSVGYLKGTVRISRELAQFESINAVPAASYEELGKLLLTGEIDAAIAGYTFEYWRASNGVIGITPVRVLHEIEARLGIAVRKDWPELIGILDKGLAAIDRQELQPLYSRWMGPEYLTQTTAFGTTFSAEERAWLAAHPVVRVGIDAAWAPVQFVDGSGTAHGMAVAYLERLEKILGVRFEFVPNSSWTEAMRQLQEQQLDVLPSMVATQERRKRLHFTDSYLTFPAAIFSAADVAYLGGPESLRGRAVAVVRDDAVEAWLRREWPDLRLRAFRDTREALRAVARGDAFSFVGNLVTTSYHIGQSGLTQVRVAGETPFEYRLSMGVRSDWPELAAALQKGIDAIPARERDAIYRDWISIRYEQRVDYRLLWSVIAGCGVLLLLVLAERALALKRANDRLRRLARENALVEERERRRLATELHDSPMQKLALAQLKLGTAQGDVGEAGAAPMGVGLELLREAQDELRTLQFELSPPMLHQEGLLPALRWLSARATEHSGVKFGFRGHATGEPLPQALAIVLYQCARELVYNVAKHSAAHSALITLDVEDSAVVLAVSDDGKGMAPASAAPRSAMDGGFGLFSIRERLALFGGTFSIASNAEGTRAVVRVPLRGRADHGDKHDETRVDSGQSAPGEATT